MGDLQRITAGEYAQIEVVFLANGLHVVRATFRCDLTTALKRAEREPAPHSVDAAKDHETPNGNLLTVFVDGLKFLPLLDELDIEVLKLDRITLQQQVLGKIVFDFKISTVTSSNPLLAASCSISALLAPFNCFINVMS